MKKSFITSGPGQISRSYEFTKVKYFFTLFMLNSTEHEMSIAHKSKNDKN